MSGWFAIASRPDPDVSDPSQVKKQNKRLHHRPAPWARVRLCRLRGFFPAPFLTARLALPSLARPASAAQFIEDVDEFMKGKDPESTLNELQTKYQQFKQLEYGLQQNRIRLGEGQEELR